MWIFKIQSLILSVCYSTVDGNWEEWASWSACNVSCGGGTRWRSRDCFGSFYGGAECPGQNISTEDCKTHECPIDGVWMVWCDWEECSSTCGRGKRSRSRTCKGPYYGGADCHGTFSQIRDCNTFECPSQCPLMIPLLGHWKFDGVFTEWGAYGECDVTCGGGIQWRSRSCKGPFYGGADCVGPNNDSRECNTHECPTNQTIPPLDGVFTEWGAYGECDVTCGGGIQWRSRSCEGPSFYGGADCVGQHNGSRECNTHECPIPGSWFLWSEWSPCTVSCGGGSKHRKRMCDWDSFGDLACEGDAEEVEDCHTFGCEPLAKHCADWASRGLNQSCTADVDPEGEDSIFGPVQVECDFDSEPGKAITIIHHDQETKTKVYDQESAGAYKAFLAYYTGWDEAVRIADESSECAQFMRWDCFGAVIHDTYDPHMWMTFWKNRTEQVANYFGGATPGSGNCACEETNSCRIASLSCNCDTNADMWLYDEGFVTNKAELPIHSFYAGDTGGLSEVGYVTLGPLLCSGLANSTSSPGPRLHNNGTDAMQQILKPLLV